MISKVENRGVAPSISLRDTCSNADRICLHSHFDVLTLTTLTTSTTCSAYLLPATRGSRDLLFPLVVVTLCAQPLLRLFPARCQLRTLAVRFVVLQFLHVYVRGACKETRSSRYQHVLGSSEKSAVPCGLIAPALSSCAGAITPSETAVVRCDCCFPHTPGTLFRCTSA